MDVLGKLGFDWKVALANLVNFLIIYYLLRNVVFKKLGAAIKERREKIQTGLDDAEKAKTALMMANHEKERIIGEGHQESKGLLLEAESKKEAIVESAKIEAEAEARKMRESAIKEIEILREHQKNEIKKKSVDLIISGIENVLKEKINPKKTEDIIGGLIK